VQRLDRRLQILDLKPTEVLTYDPTGKSVGENLTVEAFVTWKIAHRDQVARFIQGLGSVEQARTILGPWISGKLGAIIPEMPLDDPISTAAGKEQGKTRVDETIDRLQTKLMKSLKDQVLDEFGIDLVDIRLRRFNHPVKVRQSIFQRIKSERERKAAKYQSEG